MSNDKRRDIDNVKLLVELCKAVSQEARSGVQGDGFGMFLQVCESLGIGDSVIEALLEVEVKSND